MFAWIHVMEREKWRTSEDKKENNESPQRTYSGEQPATQY